MDYFTLPPEENVIERNRAITKYYAKIYLHNPKLYKWAGMASFASFHIGEKMKLWTWKNSGIKPFSVTCNKQNRSVEDDFQTIRVINNRIFLELGWMHLAFHEMDYSLFKEYLINNGKHQIIIDAFEKLSVAKNNLISNNELAEDLIWEANTDILWHEQSRVVQPLFNKLSFTFSNAMTLFSSFDYKINHVQTSKYAKSIFLIFMLRNRFATILKQRQIPRITNLDHRWFWITESLLKDWKRIETNKSYVVTELDYLLNHSD